MRICVCASISQDAALQASGSEWLHLKHPDCAAVVLEDDVGPLAVMTFFEDVPRTLSILNWYCLQTLPFSFRQRVFELLLEAVIANPKSADFTMSDISTGDKTAARNQL